MKGQPPTGVRVPVIGIMGGSHPKQEKSLLHDAYRLGGEIADRKWCLLTGGGTGIMEWASKGAAEKNGIVIGVLPGSDALESPPNSYCTFCIFTGLSDARNAINVRSADVIVAMGSGFGTLSEIALALKIGRSVIVYHTWDFRHEATPEPENLRRCERYEEIMPAIENGLRKSGSSFSSFLHLS